MALLLHTYSLMAAMNSHVNRVGRAGLNCASFKNASWRWWERVILPTHTQKHIHTHTHINCIVCCNYIVAWLHTENGCKSSAQEVHINCENLYSYFFENSCLLTWLLLLLLVVAVAGSDWLTWCKSMAAKVEHDCSTWAASQSLIFGFSQDIQKVSFKQQV